jgi:hypothetical protein
MRKFSLLTIVTSVLIMLAAGATGSRPRTLNASRQQNKPQFPIADKGSLKLTIETVDPELRQPTSSLKTGLKIPVAITLTNIANQPVYVCNSSDIYQDTPRLTRDGKVLPISRLQTVALQDVQKKQTCKHQNLPEPMLLKPGEPTSIDWLVLVDNKSTPSGAFFWYDGLTPGRYELSIQRRLACCDGPMIQSNTISFEVVP